MKKYLMTLTLMLTLCTLGSMARPSTQQNEPAGTELTDSTQNDEVVAFSDSTATDTAQLSQEVYDEQTSERIVFEFLSKHVDSFSGMVIAVSIVSILCFVLAPILILALLFYLIYKNRKQRMQLAQQALQSGQPLPNEPVQPAEPASADLWTKGMRQVFLGLGLTAFLGLTVGKIGLGIGILVLCIGAGNLFIAYKQQQGNNRQNF